MSPKSDAEGPSLPIEDTRSGPAFRARCGLVLGIAVHDWPKSIEVRVSSRRKCLTIGLGHAPVAQLERASAF
jgi:hypothetical protein